MKQRNAARRHSVVGLRSAATPSAIAPARERGPRCPKCDMQTERRMRARDGNAFWGCPRFPHCRGTIAIGDGAREAIVAPTTGSPLERIGKKRHRAFAAELVRRTRAGDSYDEIVLGAMRAAFPKSRRISDATLRERGLALAVDAPIYDVVCALLDEQP